MKEINEKNSIEFAKNLLDYYSEIDNGSINTILTSNDELEKRNNVGWYQHVDGKHKIFVNIPNILYLKKAVDRGIVTIDSYYAFIALCVSHEFRHYLQGKCIWDGEEIDGYGQKDVLNAQLMLYIRYFFDAYYLLNKGYVKYEEDAEKFAVINSIKFLKNSFPNIDIENATLNAVNYYAKIQSSYGGISTLPYGCKDTDEIISAIEKRIKDNYRINNLRDSLFVYNPNYYANHGYFGLDENKLLSDELIEKYSKLTDGNEQDMLVAKEILSSINKTVESLDDFPVLKKRYLNIKCNL